MGLVWAAAWLLPSMIGGAIRVGELEPEHIGGALAGVPSGFLFAFFAGIASGRRDLRDLPLATAAAYGAISGALVGILPFALGDQHDPGDRPLWILPLAVISGMTALCGITGTIATAVARWLSRQNPRTAG